MNKVIIAIRVETGFHQVKKFIFSDLACKLNQNFKLLWIAPRNLSPELKKIFGKYGDFIFIEKEDIKKNSKLENYHQSIRRSWLINKGDKLFQLYGKPRKKKWYDSILGLNLLRIFFDKIALIFIKLYYRDRDLEFFLEENNVNAIITTSYVSSISKSLFVASRNLNIDGFLMVNSWKDIFVNSFVGHKGFTQIWVWNKKMQKDIIERNSHLRDESFRIIGNPSFDKLLSYTTKYSKRYYSEKYKIDPYKHWIYATMSPPGVNKNEIDLFIHIAKQLLKEGVRANVLVRRNPNHKANDFGNIELPSNMVLTEHRIYYDSEKDEIIQPYEDEVEWLDLLHYTTLNISVPSTVTLEFLTLNKHILNIEFDSKGDINPDLSPYFESGFYKPLFEASSYVHRISSMDNLIARIKTILNSNHELNLADSHDLAVERINKELKKCLLIS